jgi:hypothetical protein
VSDNSVNCSEASLTEADDKAQRERLRRLQEEQQHGSLPLLSSISAPPPQVPFWSEDVDVHVDTTTPFTDPSHDIQSAANKVKDLEQENYRLQALEYNQGHVAAKVKENDKSRKKKEDGSKSWLQCSNQRNRLRMQRTTIRW